MMARLPDKIDSLSIPFWSDFIEKFLKTLDEYYEAHLSIPFWSDFIVVYHVRVLTINLSFNPILV